MRPWFLCPGDRCGRRVAVLYGQKSRGTGAPPWWCRTCRNLCYPVERENRADRAFRKMIKRRDRLGFVSEKPKRMRHTTFVRLGTEYLESCMEYCEAQKQRNIHMLEMLARARITWGED